MPLPGAQQGIALDDLDQPRCSADELDALFGEQPDEEVGSADELGWYGLVRHEDRPGGLILVQDEQGFRHVQEAHDDTALAAQWAIIQQEYATFCEVRANTVAVPAPTLVTADVLVLDEHLSTTTRMFDAATGQQLTALNTSVDCLFDERRRVGDGLAGFAGDRVAGDHRVGRQGEVSNSVLAGAGVQDDVMGVHPAVERGVQPRVHASGRVVGESPQLFGGGGIEADQLFAALAYHHVTS